MFSDLDRHSLVAKCQVFQGPAFDRPSAIFFWVIALQTCSLYPLKCIQNALDKQCVCQLPVLTRCALRSNVVHLGWTGFNGLDSGSGVQGSGLRVCRGVAAKSSNVPTVPTGRQPKGQQRKLIVRGLNLNRVLNAWERGVIASVTLTLLLTRGCHAMQGVRNISGHNCQQNLSA